MALFVANAPIAGSGARYDVRPVENGGRYSIGGLFAPFNFIRKMGQGACAGLLTLLGATHLAAAFPSEEQAVEGFSAVDGASLEAIVETMFQGGAPGVIEILGAIALFLNAGRGPARLLGLLSFVVIVAAHANGMDHSEMLEKAGELYELARETLIKFQAARAN